MSKRNKPLSALPPKFQDQARAQGATDPGDLGKLQRLGAKQRKAKKKAPRQLETPMNKAAVVMLNLRGCFCWRMNTGGAQYENKDGSKRYVKYGVPGTSDVLGMLPGGRFLAAEGKIAPNKPTPDQWAFLDAVNAAGGLGIWFNSLAELEAKIKRGVGDSRQSLEV